MIWNILTTDLKRLHAWLWVPALLLSILGVTYGYTKIWIADHGYQFASVNSQNIANYYFIKFAAENWFIVFIPIAYSLAVIAHTKSKKYNLLVIHVALLPVYGMAFITFWGGAYMSGKFLDYNATDRTPNKTVQENRSRYRCFSTMIPMTPTPRWPCRLPAPLSTTSMTRSTLFI
jgi:hypothetical protein